MLALPVPDEPPRIMCNGLIAKKIGMSRVFLENGDAIPVTYLSVEPNTIVRTKNTEKDGYNAVVLGIKPKKWKTRKGKEHTRYADRKEWKVESLDGMDIGSTITCEKFEKDSKVAITGVSKGKGFQGVIKRHKFSSGPGSHGSHHHRRPGSVGMCEFPGRVMKGKRMPGRMGNDNVTLHNRVVMACDTAKGLIAIKGPIPGTNGGNVYITLEQS